VRAIADSNRTAHRLGKLNGETRAVIMPATAAAAVPEGLELQRMKSPLAIFAENKRTVSFVKLLGNFCSVQVRLQRKQAEQIMRGRAGLPAVRVNFRATIAESFGVACGYERCH